MKENTQLTLQLFFKTVQRHRGLAFWAFFGVTFAVLSGMALPFVYKEFVNSLASEPTRPELIRLLLWIVGFGLMEWVMWRIASYSIAVLQPRGMKEITDQCFSHLHRHSFNFFNNQFVGSLVKRLTRMARSFEEILDLAYYEFYPLALRTILVNVVLALLNPWLGFMAVTWTLIFLLIHYWISRYKLKRYDLPKSEADTRVTAYLADTVTNSTTIKLFSNLVYEIKKFAEVTLHWTQKITEAWVFSLHVEAVQGFLMVILNGAILYYAIQLWQTQLLSVGDFVLIQIYLGELFMQLWDFGRYLRRLYESLADAEEMTVILNMPFEIVDRPKALALNVRKGAVEFRNVDFSYMEQEEMSLLKGFSFTVKPGDRIALIGPSGGGKTTIVKLLLRFFDVDKGKILIDGHDIASVTQDSLRSQIAVVPQDPILFHRSLMENIRYGRLEASDEEVKEAAKLAHCHQFIRHFSKGYETRVGERGVKLSGGERQRVAIARAILANTKILILDEATSSLDSESEKLIKDALKVLMKGKTVFVIAHRLSTVVDMDRILVLEQGGIVEEGSHIQLLRKKEGLYKRLWELQASSYLE